MWGGMREKEKEREREREREIEKKKRERDGWKAYKTEVQGREGKGEEEDQSVHSKRETKYRSNGKNI